MESLAKTIDLICREKGISKDEVIKAVKIAIINAAKKAGIKGNLIVKIGEDGKDFGVFQEKKVVDEVKDPIYEISLDEILKMIANENERERIIPPPGKTHEEIEVGDVILIQIKPEELGRIPARVAQSVILKKIKEAEKKHLYKEFKEKEGEIISGTIKDKKKNGDLIIDLGRIVGILPYEEQIPKERNTSKYELGKRVRGVIYDVLFNYKLYSENKFRYYKDYEPPYVILSRTHPKFLKKLMEIEIPEVRDGLVEIKAVAREPGIRAKVAVDTNVDYIDPVGACIGLKGSRIHPISQELSGEKVEVIRYSDNLAEFVKRALSPARVLLARVIRDDEEEKRVEVVVPDEDVSLAIGNKGINAKLAAKLTGAYIDIIRESDYKKMLELQKKEEKCQ
jgi:N utilization substance protein A